MITYILLFLISFVLAVILTKFVKYIAITYKVLDVPKSNRKIHKKPIPLLGGLGIYAAFFLSMILYFLFFDALPGEITLFQFTGLFIAATIIMIGGYIDDRYDIGKKSLLFPFFAILIVLPFDIGIDKITNPLGGVLQLDMYQFTLFTFNDILYSFTIFVDVFTILWLLGMSYTTKLLDGLDGLVAGITAIGAFMIFLLSMSDAYYQADVALIACILVGVMLGFLVYNFHPAKIFLGEGGSVFCGFMLGVLAIISGGKIATMLLVMGIPILDIIWIIIRRLKSRKSIAEADGLHLHHRLLYIGMTHRQAVLLLYFLSFSFGISTLFLQSLQKVFALLLLVVVMAILGAVLVTRYKKKNLDSRVNQNI